MSESQTFQKKYLNLSNDLINYPNSYFAIGTKQKTIVGLRLGYNDEASGYYIDKYKYGNGDGSVPYESASMLYKGVIPKKTLLYK
ncbi:hypothetical protein FACS1894132_05870 [Clostridia bacterium]|nr:hypothetical protein FACS1894132_05870 [Clostridia bacterium]